MAKRRVGISLALSAVVAVAMAACSEATRYEVLSFFLDGVPKPGEEQPRGYTSSGRPFPAQPGSAAEADSETAPRVRVVAHAPYQEGRCDACHDRVSGGLVGGEGQDLCRGCHAEVPGPLRYVHGPVAVSDCRFCHHYHGSPYPPLLLEEASSLCLRCHDGDRLASTDTHRDLGTQTCDQCHHAHGGEDSFFLKLGER